MLILCILYNRPMGPMQHNTKHLQQLCKSTLYSYYFGKNTKRALQQLCKLTLYFSKLCKFLPRARKFTNFVSVFFGPGAAPARCLRRPAPPARTAHRPSARLRPASPRRRAPAAACSPLRDLGYDRFSFLDFSAKNTRQRFLDTSLA